jgi:hypothetical protein
MSWLHSNPRSLLPLTYGPFPAFPIPFRPAGSRSKNTESAGLFSISRIMFASTGTPSWVMIHPLLTGIFATINALPQLFVHSSHLQAS